MRSLSLLLALQAFAAEWPQFGGPNGDFTAGGAGLAASWPAAGPKLLWKRALGEGYSGIVTSAGTLYTMTRRGNQEVVVALDAASGRTKWEYAYDATFRPGMGMEHGPGPHVTPAVAGNHVYTIGVMSRMHALDTRTGKVVWTKDLYKDFPGSTTFDRGYSPSPIVHRGNVLVKLGGNNHAIVALSPKDGSLVWQKHGFENSPSTPAVVKIDGREQILTSFSGEFVGLDAATGELLWQHAHRTQYGLNIASPVLVPGNIVVVTSAYNGGARGVEVSSAGGKFTTKELWQSNRFRVHFTNVVRIGGYVYGSSGDFGPAPMTAVDAKSGRVAWQDRTFAKASLVQAGDKTILLDEDGVLALVQLSPQGMKVVSRAQTASHNAWTVPTLAGTTLYIRDRRDVMAFDLR